MIVFKNVLLTLTLSMAGSLSAADFLPLASGNTWTYRDASTGSTFEIRASTPIVMDNKVYHGLRGFSPKQLYVRSNEYGNLVMLDEDQEKELLVTSFETGSLIGQFEAYGRQCPASGKARENKVVHQGPAGYWNATEVEFKPYACADAGEISEQYVENIGMVRRVVNTIAGPRTYDLVHARIGNQVITAGEAGLFSVTALPGADFASWLITLRVVPQSNGGPMVTFPSSQEYDLRLRNADGTILWTWSADKIFAQAVHERSISGLTATVTVPHPPAVPEGARAYTLEAWLTTAPNGPQFAAATLLTLPSLPRTAASAGRVRR